MTEPSDLGEAAISTQRSAGYNIFVLSNIVSAGYYERAERAFGLTIAQWTVLRTVMITPGISQSDVARACGLNVMNVSRAATGLREKGLVSSSSDPHNQRRNLLEATELGESIGKDLAEREELVHDHVFADLTSSEVEQLDELLVGLIERLADHPPPEPPPPSRDWRAVLDNQS